MAAGWFCEKSGSIVKVEDSKPVLFKLKNRFQPATILRRRIFTWMNFEIGGFLKYAVSRTAYHMALRFRLSVRYRLVAVW
jgi:hypothetical protein